MQVLIEAFKEMRAYVKRATEVHSIARSAGCEPEDVAQQVALRELERIRRGSGAIVTKTGEHRRNCIRVSLKREALSMGYRNGRIVPKKDRHAGKLPRETPLIEEQYANVEQETYLNPEQMMFVSLERARQRRIESLIANDRVLSLLANGWTMKAIARDTGLSVSAISRRAARARALIAYEDVQLPLFAEMQ